MIKPVSDALPSLSLSFILLSEDGIGRDRAKEKRSGRVSKRGDRVAALVVVSRPEWQGGEGTSRRQRKRCPQSVARFTTVSIQRTAKRLAIRCLRLSAHYTPCVPVFSSEGSELLPALSLGRF